MENKVMKEETVLIVDDQPNWREVLSRLLEDDYDVTSVSSYEEALRVLERGSLFAAAIIDIRLDEMNIYNEDGLQLLRNLWESSTPTSVIVLTGYSTVRTVKEAFRNLGAFDYIDKSMLSATVEDFRKTVHTAVQAFKERRKGSQMRPTVLRSQKT